MDIKITYLAIDGARMSRKFKTLAGAQAFAAKWVGETPETAGNSYAVSGDGVGRITVQGVKLLELFPKLAPAPADGDPLGDLERAETAANIQAAQDDYAAYVEAMGPGEP